MSSWKLYLFLLIVAVGSVVCQDDDDADADADADEPVPEAKESSCSGCKDGRNCWYEGDWFLKDEMEYECVDGKIQKKADANAGMCLAHSAIGREKFMKPDEEYVLRCNTWKCSGEFKIMMFKRAACRDDMDKCFEDDERLVKNGHTVICRIYGTGHVYELAPEDEQTTPAPDADEGKK